MDIEQRVLKAKELFAQGYNCSQAVLLAYSDMYGLDRDIAAMMAAPLGGGVGRMREVCGAVTGMALVAGLEIPVTDPKNKEAKMNNYALVRDAGTAFKEKHGSVVCRDLLGLGKDMDPQLSLSGHPLVKANKHSCADMVETAARIIGMKLKERKLL